MARASSGADNQCHVFAELEPEQPATAIVNFVNKVIKRLIILLDPSFYSVWYVWSTATIDITDYFFLQALLGSSQKKDII